MGGNGELCEKGMTQTASSQTAWRWRALLSDMAMGNDISSERPKLKTTAAGGRASGNGTASSPVCRLAAMVAMAGYEWG